MVNKENLFCSQSTLRNESDVEQFFVIKLLNDLGYNEENIHTKKTVSIKTIGKGKTKKEYRPDYLIYINKKIPIICIDVKHPNISPDEGLKDALMYTREINGEYKGKNPIKFCIGTNGISTKIAVWDENEPKLILKHGDFQLNNQKYNELRNAISYNTLKNLKRSVGNKDFFEFIKPDVREINGIFKKCHTLIWKKEKIGPTASFYEFCKLMFIKLDEDKKLKHKRNGKGVLEKEDFIFSYDWIKKEKKIIANPINNILFKNLKDKLEEKIETKNKKRIFEKNEEIKLKPSTIEQVVKLLEHYDLISIDEDLNGRLFETFLSATIRGKELGQFFTPRSVVKFMTKMAHLKIDFQNEKIDTVLDGCCGTGGFLIETMSDLVEKINSNESLTNNQKKSFIEKVRKDCIYGVDASPMISRIARINMYLHGDGGSLIYNLDFLDKKIKIESGIDNELKGECLEYYEMLITENLKFDVVLTNPPFSMRYGIKDPDDEKILEDYYLAKNPDTKKMVASLKSNVMFIERFYELLKPHGKLITIIDESLLTTPSHQAFRDFIKEKFIIKSVISLPENTFVKADTGVKTSILYLVKKENMNEIQPSVFMSLCENVGHNDAGRLEPESNELFSSARNNENFFSKGIIGNFYKFENGEFESKEFDINENVLPNENDWKTFITEFIEEDRLDVKSHSPYLKNLTIFLKNNNNWCFLENLINIEEKESPKLTDFYRLIDLRNIEEKTAKILKINEVEELNSDKLVFKKDELLISLLSPEKGKIILVDDKLNGCVGSTELIPVTIKSEKILMEYLWVILRSKIVLDQWKYQVTGSTPSRYRIGVKELNTTIIPIPDKEIQKSYSKKIIDLIHQNDEVNKTFQNEFEEDEINYINNILKIH